MDDGCSLLAVSAGVPGSHRFANGGFAQALIVFRHSVFLIACPML